MDDVVDTEQMTLADLLALPDDALLDIFAVLSPAEKVALSAMMDDYALNPYVKYNGDIERIIYEEWGEGLWRKQREILKSFVTNQRTCVVTTPGVGKSHLVALIICALVASALHDPHRIRIITTAANFRLVRVIIWPYIKRMAAHYKLPGHDSKFKPSRIGSVEWHVENTLVADGVAAADQDETAMRGIHSLGRVVVVVDEASGISHTIGRVLNGLLTTPEDRLIVLGNPPTDQTDTWFEWYANQAIVNTIHIPFTETPNFTGEPTPNCTQCDPRRQSPHSIAKHVTSLESVNAVKAQYPDDNDPYVRAFLYAEFPKGNTAKAIPMQFLENALPVMKHRINETTGLAETYADDPEWEAAAKAGGPIRLGIDVAADGGDEFVIAKRHGWHGTIIHTATGPDNEDASKVAGACKRFILEAVEQHKAEKIKEPVVVNVDRNGVGWGVEGELRNWVERTRQPVEVVGVMVSEKARQEQRFTKQRSEIWWNFRELLADPDTKVTLEDDRHLGKRSVIKQLNGPTYVTETNGRIQIEPKAKMKARTGGPQGISPDRADAMLLAYYESPSRHRNIVPGPFPELGKGNEFAADQFSYDG